MANGIKFPQSLESCVFAQGAFKFRNEWKLIFALPASIHVSTSLIWQAKKGVSFAASEAFGEGHGFGGKAMVAYGLYCMDGVGRIRLAETLEAIDAQEAVYTARYLKLHPTKCEIWHLSRLVASLDAKDLEG